jgi:uncharacterized protein YcnI
VRHLWLTLEQLRSVTGWAYSTVAAKAAAGELTWRPIGGARGSGRKPREYSAASLPAEFHSKLLAFELAGASSTSLQLSTTAGLGPDGARATSPAEASGQGALFPETSALPGRAFEALTPEQQQQRASAWRRSSPCSSGPADAAGR